VLGGESVEVSGRRISSMDNWRAVGRLARAGYLRAVWSHGPLRGMEYFLTASGEVEVAARHARLR